MRVEALSGLPDGTHELLAESGVEELYPPQADAVAAGVTEGSNLVAAVPTASGKTLMASLAMLSAVERGGSALYIVPLRALASEKRDEFATFEAVGVDVGISTGNYDSTDDWLAAKDIVVATSEKVDSLIRNGASWIDDLACVVADEVHLVDDAHRGPTLEVTLAKLRQQLPDLQTVALSATIGNADAIADWLDAELVESTWRPIDLKRGVYYGNAINFDDGSQYELPGDREKPEATLVADTVADDGSALVFVNSRRNAEAAARRLGDAVEPYLGADERRRLDELADELRDVSDTQTSRDLAAAVESGTSFHHAGLCVTGDTQILRTDGTFDEIRDLVDLPSGGAMGLDEFSVGPVAITDTFVMGERPVLELETRTGNQLKLSKNHPLAVLGEDGIKWIRAGDIDEGMYVARPRTLTHDVEPPRLRELVRGEHRVYRQYDEVRRLAGIVGETNIDRDRLRSYGKDRNIKVDDFRQLCSTAGTDPNQHLGQVICTAGQKPVSVPRVLNQDICWLAGAVAGDGYANRHRVALTGKSNLPDEFERIVGEQFDRGVNKTVSSSGTPSVSLNSKLVSDLLVDHFGIPRGLKSGQLEMPTIALPDQLLASYISGLFDTDGSVSPRSNQDGAPCIEFYSSSENLITQLKTSLLRFDIIAYRDLRRQKGHSHLVGSRSITARSDIYRLTIYGTDQLRRFEKHIGFRHEKKSHQISNAIEKNPSGGRNQLDVIPPGLGGRVRTARESAGLSLEDLDSTVPKATVSRYENGVTPMKRESFRRLARRLDDQLLTLVATSDIYWDRIESVEKREQEPLFDLSTTSSNFIANGIIAHNTSDHRSKVEDAFRDRVLKAVCATPTLAAGVNTPSRRVVVRDWRRYDSGAGGMKPLSTLEVHQMFGRAGRPQYDDYGEAVLIASGHDEYEELFDRYIYGEPEPVRSKLATEPALRTHLLATVATGFATTRGGLLDFLDRTLYAVQTTEPGRLERVTDTVLDYLEVNEFLERDGDALEATRLGHATSQLYLDPMSAAEIVDGLRAAEELTALGCYHLVCRTPDMYQLYLRSGDRETFTELAYEREAELPGRTPSEFDDAFEDWLSALKTAKLLEDWADELDEDRITERYGVGPGDIHGKVDTAQWLLQAAERLSSELGLDTAGAVREARLRVEHGVKEELLDLVGVSEVGRVRARQLYDAGIESREALREAPKARVLGALRGRRKTAETILRNAGRPDPSMDGVDPGGDGTAGDEVEGASGTDGRSAAEADEAQEQSGLGDFT